MTDVNEALQVIQENSIEFIDLRFADTHGKEQHVTIPASEADEDFFVEGKMFDGSSIDGWKGINESDMVLMPDPSKVAIDPFYETPTAVIRCDVLEPATMMGYSRDPRTICKRAEEYLSSTGIADTCLCGPEPEFFVLDDVRWQVEMKGCSYQINSEESIWSSNKKYSEGNKGHRPAVKGGYFPVPPVDSLQEVRTEICQVLQHFGHKVEVHHHEVATSGQCEIGTKFNTLTNKADEVLELKYAVQNVADTFGKTATFMPKPVVGDNGSGMHVHQSLAKEGQNIFAGDGYAGLSENALYYIGGIIKHAKALNAFVNASTNSYKRLVPGFEAPVLLAYSARNRSAAIRIPYAMSDKGRRVEIRFGDSMGNPYLSFAALLMAGIDGIQNQIHPGDAMDKNLYDLPPEELEEVPTVASSFEEALNALDSDREFLKAGGVFTDDLIDAYIELKMEQVQKLKMTTHPVEFDMYYSL
jgi:glutamine synthetase